MSPPEKGPREFFHSFILFFSRISKNSISIKEGSMSKARMVLSVFVVLALIAGI